jgi:hypothetical protein
MFLGFVSDQFVSVWFRCASAEDLNKPCDLKPANTIYCTTTPVFFLVQLIQYLWSYDGRFKDTQKGMRAAFLLPRQLLAAY